ncbi:MAG TPA: aminodeoxychorismate/anthranilate synthase component II [Thermoplasmata archaeon]|nr:aminodeoxychorismate/anthranilate synthase component II [Thermoplasmata archaeon]
MRVLLVDNYDSFAYNLYQALGALGAEVLVRRNDAISLEQTRDIDPDAVVISPGPGNPTNPRDFGVNAEILREVSPAVPTLGVCLGHQGIGAVFGGRIVHAGRLVHGKTSQVRHDGQGIYAGLPNPFPAARYHSLAVDAGSLPPELLVTATAEDGEVMGVRHARHPIEGVQFHPESILTPDGPALLANFLKGVRR